MTAFMTHGGLVGSRGALGWMSRLATVTAATGVATGVALGAEVVWAARRHLPVGAEIDATGRLRDHLPGAPLRVAVLGDSTLTGPGLSDAGEVWVRQALAAVDVGRPLDVVSFAVGGSRVADVRARLADAFDAPVDLVILAVGANDAIHGTGRRVFAESYDELVAEILRHAPVVAVANIGDLGNIARIPAPLRHVARARGRAFCRIIERTAVRHAGAVLLDVSPANAHFRDRSLFGPDLFHPTRDGHARWAEAVQPSLLLALCRAA